MFIFLAIFRHLTGDFWGFQGFLALRSGQRRSNQNENVNGGLKAIPTSNLELYFKLDEIFP